MLSELSIGLVILTIFLVWGANRLLAIGSRQSGLPSGPPTVPFLGNLHVFPKNSTHLRFTDWARLYGDIYSLKMGTSTAVVLSSPRVVHKLLHLRSANTSDRPSIHFNDITSGGLNLVLAPYNTTWRLMRQVVKDMLSHDACMNHLPIQRAEATQLMHDLLVGPAAFYTHVRRYSNSVILSLAFGVRCARYEGTLVEDFYEVQRMWADNLEPGALPPIDIIPLLRYLPESWASWKGLSREIRSRQRNLYFGLVERCRRRIQSGCRNNCFIESVLDHQEQYNLDDEMLAYTGGVVMEAGSDTVAVFLQSFIFCLAVFPEVQIRARQKIDKVVGRNRSPRFEDFKNLPYCDAIIKEVHRFRPVAPTGIPHLSGSDEVIDGYTVPKGSVIFMNIWGIGHDPESFEHPDVFHPDRFLQSDFGTKKGADNRDRRHDTVFGSGKRICPGIEFANNSIILNVMNLLWGFEFQPAKNPQTGNPIPIDVNAMTNGLLSAPKPFLCDIRPRSELHAEIIRSDFLEARETFSQFEKESTKIEMRGM